MSKFIDYLSTFFIADDEIATHKAVSEAQQAIIDRQHAEGKRGFFEYVSLSKEVQAAGSDLSKYRDKNDDIIKVVPFWAWVALAIAAFAYLGGFKWLKGILAKKST